MIQIKSIIVAAPGSLRDELRPLESELEHLAAIAAPKAARPTQHHGRETAAKLITLAGDNPDRV